MISQCGRPLVTALCSSVLKARSTAARSATGPVHEPGTVATETPHLIRQVGVVPVRAPATQHTRNEAVPQDGVVVLAARPMPPARPPLLRSKHRAEFRLLCLTKNMYGFSRH